MGQKVHPYSFRLGIVTDWKSKWYADKGYVELVNEDWKIREYLRGELRRGAVSSIDIERTRDRVVVEVHTARPGVVIGRKGSEAERLRSELEKMASKPVKLNIIELKDAETDARLLAQGIADQLENRVAFRRAMKRAVATAMKAGAEGVRVEAKGRLGGSDMGRREWYREGRVPLHTIRADIDFGTATAFTTVGTIGIKVWVYKGDVVGAGSAASREKIAAEAALATGRPASRGRAVPAKARAEQAAGAERVPRLIEAGGGKRAVEAGGKPAGKRLIEAGGGKRRLDPDQAEQEYREERKVAESDETTVPPAEDVIAEDGITDDLPGGDAPVTDELPGEDAPVTDANAALDAEAPALEAEIEEAPVPEAAAEDAPVSQADESGDEPVVVSDEDSPADTTSQDSGQENVVADAVGEADAEADGEAEADVDGEEE